jgi:hypothetical protein
MLAGKHVAMVGDSVTRYQHHSLAYFLEHGEFPPRFPKAKSGACVHVDEEGRPTCSPSDQPNICVESDWVGYEGWRGWDGFYAGVCGGTSGGVMNGRMECHSFRIWKPPGQQLECHENVLYSNPNSSAVLSFAFETGRGDGKEGPIHGFRFTNCSYSGTCRRSAHDAELIKNRTHSMDFDFSQPFPEAIDKNGTLRLALPRPDIALVRHQRSQ